MGEMREDGSGRERCWAGGELVRAQLQQAAVCGRVRVVVVIIVRDVWWTRGRRPGPSGGGRIWLKWPRTTSRRRRSHGFVDDDYDYDYDSS
jgi:hypothetical protein